MRIPLPQQLAVQPAARETSKLVSTAKKLAAGFFPAVSNLKIIR